MLNQTNNDGNFGHAAKIIGHTSDKRINNRHNCLALLFSIPCVTHKCSSIQEEQKNMLAVRQRTGFSGAELYIP